MASHEAARRAADAGYTNLSVMSDGIVGWRNAGQRVVIPGEQSSSGSM